jgi:hypothetical protein
MKSSHFLFILFPSSFSFPLYSPLTFILFSCVFSFLYSPFLFILLFSLVPFPLHSLFLASLFASSSLSTSTFFILFAHTHVFNLYYINRPRGTYQYLTSYAAPPPPRPHATVSLVGGPHGMHRLVPPPPPRSIPGSSDGQLVQSSLPPQPSHHCGLVNKRVLCRQV